MHVLTRDGGFHRSEIRSSGTWNPGMQWGSTAPPTNGQASGMAAAGVTMSEQHALQLLACWGSVSIISDALSCLPINQWRLVNGEAVRMDPAPVVEQPWSELTRSTFIGQGTVSMALRGNLFGEVASRDPNTLMPDQVRLVHPDHAKVIRNRESGQIEVRYNNKLVTPDNVTRALALSVPEGIVGLNPVEYLRNSLGLARAQELMGGAFYANSARPDGVIEVADDLDPSETVALAKEWAQAHSGIGNAFLPAVLTNGAKFNPITMSLQDAQFLEQMQFSASAISGMIWRVPPHMLGIVDKTTSWGKGIEQQEIGFVVNTLGIWIRRWEDLIRSWLPKGQFVTFDLSERLRGDTLQRWSTYQIGRVIGAMNNVEIRKAERMPIPTDPDELAALSDYGAPLNSAPIKPTGPSEGGDGAD